MSEFYPSSLQYLYFYKLITQEMSPKKVGNDQAVSSVSKEKTF